MKAVRELTGQADRHGVALAAIASASPDHFYLYDRAGRHLYASAAAAQALGIDQADFIGKTWRELGFPAEVVVPFDVEREKIFRTGRRWCGEMNFPVTAGMPNSAHEYILSPVRNAEGVIESVVATFQGVTERRLAEEADEYQAMYDVLTDLPNRTLLSDRLQQGIFSAHRNHSRLALLVMDLDHFQEVNDAFGHFYGDVLLQQASARWRRVLRASDTLSRVGGDEFVVLLPSTDDMGAAEAVHRLVAAVEEPFEIEGHRVQISVSIGIAVHRDRSEDGSALMERADHAMYVAKHSRSDEDDS